MARRRRRKSNTVGSYTYKYGFGMRPTSIARECRMYGYSGPDAYARLLADHILADQPEPEPPHPRQEELDAARERVDDLRAEASSLALRFNSWDRRADITDEWRALEGMVYSSLKYMVFADEVEREIETLGVIRVFYEKVVAFAREQLRVA